MTLSQRVAAFVHLGKQLSEISQNKEILRTAYNQNNWFTEKNIINAAQVWAKTLSEQNLLKWIAPFQDKARSIAPKIVAVINAGNIPFVGFHDFMSVLISGNRYMGKNASDDTVLM